MTALNICFQNQFVMSEETNNLENFDWDKFENGQGGTYSDAEVKELTAMYEATLNSINESAVIDGTVTALSDREAIIEIGAKSEGVISLNEFRYNPDLKVGDTVEVIIDQREDKYGALKLSHKKARSIRSWENINLAHDNEQTIHGFVKCKTKGGLIVDVFGIEAFLPGSQIDVKPIRDYDQYVGKNMEFKVVKINHEFKNVVVSHKALIEADIEQQKKDIISKLEVGQVLEGTVKNITSYGVFVDLGGIDGLVHITDLSWSRINHPSEIVELDQNINVVILDFDEQKTRIQLGLKQLSAHPWDALAEEAKVGDTVKGKVVVLADYGAFVEILPGVEGLVHGSEMSWSTHLRSAGDFVKVGDEVEAVILTLDREERKMSLGMKQLTTDPWADISTKYPVGTTIKGKVRNFTHFGLFLELEEGIDGLIHISDLSWTEKVKHPSDFCKIGQELEAKVLEVDLEQRRLSLGHKQTTDNPWEAYATIFGEGSVHEGKVVEVSDKGASVLFEDEKVTAFCPSRHLAKEEGGSLAKGDVAKFKVIEFNKGSQRVVVSHSSIYREEKAKDNKKSKDMMNKMNSNNEKSTLGDISALAALKDKLDGKK
jgi:small subunit ribosomal protein S1